MSCRKNGFTMIELMLALTLTSMLTAALSVMIGQAARDRHAMQQQTQEPAWMQSFIDIIERDLCEAQWWAGAEDRLVVIGIGRDGLPVQIEYRWVAIDFEAAVTRKESPLTDGVIPDAHEERLLAIGLHEFQIGAFQFGGAMDGQHASSGPSVPASFNGPRLLIKGRRLPLQALPDTVSIELALGADHPSIDREVVLR